MNKRTFLKTSAALSLGALAPIRAFSLSFPGKKDYPEYWVWRGVDKDSTTEEIRAQFKELKSQGIDGILIGGDDERNFFLASEAGLEPHLWMWTMNRRDEYIMENHPDWYAVNRLGESCFDKPQYVDYYRWLCPSKQGVQDFLLDEVKEKANKPYIKGIHLDYVRYCDVILPSALWEKYDIVQNEELPPYDYCYCDTCRTKFKQRSKYDPLEIEDPSQDKLWLQYRYDSITSIVNKLAQAVHAADKPISAAVFPTPTIARKLVRQDWDKWNLDMVFPMLYHGFYEEDIAWIGESLEENINAVGHRMNVYSGLYLPDLPEPRNLAEATQLSEEKKASGVSLFGGVSEEHWGAFQRVIRD